MFCPCFVMQYFKCLSSFSIISLRKRELVSYFNCVLNIGNKTISVLCLFIVVPWSVIVAISGTTHLLLSPYCLQVR